MEGFLRNPRRQSGDAVRPEAQNNHQKRPRVVEGLCFEPGLLPPPSAEGPV